MYNNSICEEKKVLRENYKKIRKEIKNKEEKSELIIKRIINSDLFINSKIIALYKSFSSEANLESLIEYSLKNGKRVALPRVKNNYLDFYEINSLDEKLIKNKFGIEEPKEDMTKFIIPQKIDLAIIPGLAFDKDKNRLGYGGGYYDRFLLESKAIKIGICFDEQLLKTEKLPVTETDIKMDTIITDKEMII